MHPDRVFGVRAWRSAATIAVISIVGCGATSEVTERPTTTRSEAHASDLEASGTAEDGVDDETVDVPETTVPEDACASIVPDPSWNGEPLFVGADPCERVRADCAWSLALHRCAHAEPVSACPATLSEAQGLSLACDYSLQPALSCTYGDTICSCVRPRYCGGAAPPPTLEHPPATLTCVPPFDDRGCPTGAVREGARCTLDPEVSCITCSTLIRCERGRWQIQTLPPRP